MMINRLCERKTLVWKEYLWAWVQWSLPNRHASTLKHMLYLWTHIREYEQPVILKVSNSPWYFPSFFDSCIQICVFSPSVFSSLSPSLSPLFFFFFTFRQKYILVYPSIHNLLVVCGNTSWGKAMDKTSLTISHDLQLHESIFRCEWVFGQNNYFRNIMKTNPCTFDHTRQIRIAYNYD